MEVLSPARFDEVFPRMALDLSRLGASSPLARGRRSAGHAGRSARLSLAAPARRETEAPGAFFDAAEDGFAGWPAGGPEVSASYIARCYLENQLVFIVPKFTFLA